MCHLTSFLYKTELKQKLNYAIFLLLILSEMRSCCQQFSEISKHQLMGERLAKEANRIN